LNSVSFVRVSPSILADAPAPADPVLPVRSPADPVVPADVPLVEPVLPDDVLVVEPVLADVPDVVLAAPDMLALVPVPIIWSSSVLIAL
jgi:hypothetical protein